MNLKRPTNFKPRGISLAIIVLAALLIVAAGILLSRSTTVSANSNDLMNAETQYPGIVGSRIDTCALCHTSNIPMLNPYGSDYLSHGRSMAALVAIQNLDSDGDGYSNIVEINAHTFPGDPADHPAAATSTPTSVPTKTPTAVPSATRTPVASTSTAVASPTSTSVVPPTATSGVPPTATAVPTEGNTSVPAATSVGNPARTPRPTKTMGPKPTEGCEDDREDEQDDGGAERSCTAVPHVTRTPRPTRTMGPDMTATCFPGGRQGGDDFEQGNENGNGFGCTPTGVERGRGRGHDGGEDNGMIGFIFPIRELAGVFTSGIFHR